MVGFFIDLKLFLPLDIHWFYLLNNPVAILHAFIQSNYEADNNSKASYTDKQDQKNESGR